MNQVFGTPSSGAVCCSDAAEEALSLYMDGELPDALQPALFAHLAACDRCRRQLDAVMKFRRMSRLEHLSMPPGVDDAFFKRLASHKRRNRFVDRAADRRPLWQARAPVSLRGAVMVALLLFITGLLIPVYEEEPPQQQFFVRGEEERVEFLDPAPDRHEAVYVFYPGLTIEAVKIEAVKAEDHAAPEPL